MADGTQRSMYHPSEYVCILHIHRSPTGIEYRFIQPNQSYQSIPLDYTIFGLSITIEQRSFILPVKSFYFMEIS